MAVDAPVTVVVEGKHDEPVARRILGHAGLEVSYVYVAGGKAALDSRLKAYNNAARLAPWFVLRDFDHDAPCASTLIESTLGEPSAQMCLRFPKRAVESWLLADRESIAAYLSVSAQLVPASPDEEINPKVTLVNLARRSRRRSIREDMTPAPGTSGAVGPGYTSRIIEYATHHWRPDAARSDSASLARCMAALAKWKT